MQNLPITAIVPATPAKPAVSTDSSPAQASEPFSNVLTRQQANASAENAGARDSKQAGPPSASDASSASGNEKSSGPQAPAPAAVSTLPGGIMAALLTVSSGTDSDESRGMIDPLPPSQGTITALPGDMLATLIPPSATSNSITAKEKNRTWEITPDKASALPEAMLATLISAPAALQERSAAVRPEPLPAALQERSAALRPEPLAADVPGRPVPSSNIQDALSLPGAQGSGSARPADKVGATASGSTFAAALETLGKNSAIASQLASGSTEFSAPAKQPDAAANLVYLSQNGTAPVAASSNAPAQAAVHSPVAQDGWGDEFGQKITWLASQNIQSAELHLNPPQLGPLDVVLSISGDQATALFTSPHAAVRDAVEQALPRLREMLSDSGIMLGNTMVGDQSPKEQQAWLASQQQNRSGNLSGKSGDAAAIDSLPSAGTAIPVRRHQGMVDTFA